MIQPEGDLNSKCLIVNANNNRFFVIDYVYHINIFRQFNARLTNLKLTTFALMRFPLICKEIVCHKERPKTS